MKYHLLLISVLLVICVDCANSPATQSSVETPNKGQTRLILTSEAPSLSLPLDVKTFANSGAILQISIADIENPSLTPFSIVAYFELKSATESGQPNSRIAIGSISPYPANMPGKFVVSAGDAVEKLSAVVQEQDSSTVMLILELQPISETKPLPAITVNLAPIEWLDSEHCC